MSKIYPTSFIHDETTKQIIGFIGSDGKEYYGGLAVIGDGAVKNVATNYVLALSDNGAVVELNSGSAITATVPSNATAPFPIGAQVNVMQYGAGAASIVAAGGVTIRYLSTLNLSAQYAIVTLIKIGVNEWKAVGELS